MKISIGNQLCPILGDLDKRYAVAAEMGFTAMDLQINEWGVGQIYKNEAFGFFDRSIEELIEHYASEYGVPASSVYAIVFAESTYRPEVVSSSGAVGLMQIMPSTYRSMLEKMGEYDSLLVDTLHFSTELNVKAAVFYMHRLIDRFDIINEKERLNYILGSYNGGSNHIFDAMRLARKRGINRYNWNSLSSVLERMNEEDFYTDSVCKFGYYDATETLMYVDKVQRK